MNQREYSWESAQITNFLDDIIKIFEEGKYVEKMGSIINLNYDEVNDIYDGQQRTLTVILILNVLGCLAPKLKTKINQLLTVDTELDDLTQQQNKIKEECKVNIIPKIYCINPYDMTGLVNIFNNKIQLWAKFINNLDEIKSFEEEGYVCSICKTKISRNNDFIRHIKKKHNYLQPDSSTKLHSAFTEIYNYLVLKKYDEKKLINLYKFILFDIDIQTYDCFDPEYVSRIFDWENNRGKAVETLDIIKNQILVKITDEKKVEIYNRWESLKHRKNKIYKKNFGQKIFDLAIQLFSNQINRTINNEKLYKPIIDSEDIYKKLIKFFEIVEKLFEIMDKISEDKFGRLLNNTSRVSINWEAYMWCLLPISYKTGYVDCKLIKLMTKWYFRNLQFKNLTFNNLCYSNEFIRITNQVIQNKDFDYYKDIEECLIKNKDDSISNENYLRTIKDMNYTTTNAKHLLMFLETCVNTDTHIVPLDYTLEHIYPKKNKAHLTNPSLMNNIGNLTLIEGKNSKNGHKGNSSLGSKPYYKKMLSYKGSSSMITRDITNKFETFTEATITTRNDDITSLLNKYTNY
tara:strand:- start:159 stop:1880 length:1722 start_codon:yes stop_codon:yes gene_type:complete